MLLKLTSAVALAISLIAASDSLAADFRVASGEASTAIEQCDAQYRQLLGEAKDALVSGDRRKTEELLKAAKAEAERCARIEEKGSAKNQDIALR